MNEAVEELRKAGSTKATLKEKNIMGVNKINMKVPAGDGQWD